MKHKHLISAGAVACATTLAAPSASAQSHETGIGALGTLCAFIFPETRSVSTAKAEHRVIVTPHYTGRNDFGLSAFARF